MREVVASIDVYSRSATLAELRHAIGIPEDEAISHERGTPKSPTDSWKVTIWRLGSTTSRRAKLSEHIADLASRFPLERLADRSALPKDAKVLLNVAAFGDSTTGWVELTSDDITVLARGKLGMEVTYYCCEELDEDSQSEARSEP